MPKIVDDYGLEHSNEIEVIKGEEENITLLLEKALEEDATAVKGIIYEADGIAEIANAIVEVYDDAELLVGKTKTINDGAYLFELPGGGEYYLQVTKQGYLESEKTQIDVLTGEIKEENISLTKIFGTVGTVYGIVKDEDDNQVDNAKIVAYRDNQEVAITHSIADGEYILTDLPLNFDYEIVVTAHGYRPKVIEDIKPDYIEDTIEQNFALTRIGEDETGTIKGEIAVKETLIPIPDAFVALYEIIDNEEKIILSTYSNEDGEYAFYDVLPGNYKVKAKAIKNIMDAQ